MRHNIEASVRRTFHRERRQIASCIVTVAPARWAGETGFACRLRLWSAELGQVGVRDFGDTIRTAVQQAALRTREVARRRMHKRRAQARRLGRHQLSRWLQGIKTDWTRDG